MLSNWQNSNQPLGMKILLNYLSTDTRNPKIVLSFYDFHTTFNDHHYYLTVVKCKKRPEHCHKKSWVFSL